MSASCRPCTSRKVSTALHAVDRGIDLICQSFVRVIRNIPRLAYIIRGPIESTPAPKTDPGRYKRTGWLARRPARCKNRNRLRHSLRNDTDLAMTPARAGSGWMRVCASRPGALGGEGAFTWECW